MCQEVRQPQGDLRLTENKGGCLHQQGVQQVVVGGDELVGKDIRDRGGHKVVEGETFVMGEGGRQRFVNRASGQQCRKNGYRQPWKKLCAGCPVLRFYLLRSAVLHPEGNQSFRL